MKKVNTKSGLMLGVLLLLCNVLTAQFTLSGQVRTRSEYRDGTGTLRPVNNQPAFFTSQRTRLSFGYKNNRIQFLTSVQDVRVWGQDASSISNADGSKLGVHEAWAEVTLANKKDTSFKKAKFMIHHFYIYITTRICSALALSILYCYTTGLLSDSLVEKVLFQYSLTLQYHPIYQMLHRVLFHQSAL